MDDKTLKKIGDFQEDVGKFSSKMNIIGSYLFAGIIVVFCIIIIFVAIRKKDCSYIPDDLKKHERCGKRNLKLLFIILCY